MVVTANAMEDAIFGGQRPNAMSHPPAQRASGVSASALRKFRKDTVPPLLELNTCFVGLMEPDAGNFLQGMRISQRKGKRKDNTKDDPAVLPNEQLEPIAKVVGADDLVGLPISDTPLAPFAHSPLLHK